MYLELARSPSLKSTAVSVFEMYIHRAMESQSFLFVL
jgi:hypothetical protein